MKHIRQIIIQSLKHNGLDQRYIAEKTFELQKKTEFECLHFAVTRLDKRNKKYIAQKLGLTLNELNITAKVMNKI